MNHTIITAAPEVLEAAAAGAAKYEVELSYDQLALLNAVTTIAVNALKSQKPVFALPDGLSITGAMSVHYPNDSRDIVLRVASAQVFAGAREEEPISAWVPGMGYFDTLMNAVVNQRSITITVGAMPTGVTLAAVDCYPQLRQADGTYPWFRVRLIIYAAYILETEGPRHANAH